MAKLAAEQQRVDELQRDAVDATGDSRQQVKQLNEQIDLMKRELAEAQKDKEEMAEELRVEKKSAEEARGNAVGAAADNGSDAYGEVAALREELAAAAKEKEQLQAVCTV